MGIKYTVKKGGDPAVELKIQESLNKGLIIVNKETKADGSYEVELSEAVNFTM
jgi:hypothetical protein